MKKILQINTVSNTGSTGKITEGISRCIVAENWESYVAFGRPGTDSAYSKEIVIGSKKDFYMHALGTRLFDEHGFFSTSATRDFLRKVDTIRPDLIHLHNIHGYYINVKLLFDYLKKRRVPVVWTLHDCWPYTGHCAYYSKVGCNRWETTCYDCPQTAAYPKSYIDFSTRNFTAKKNIFCNVDNLSIVTPSHWLKEELKKSFLNNYDSHVINNGIDLQKFNIKAAQGLKRKLGITDERIVLGVASIWEPRKGFGDFIALNEILNEHNFKIVMVGLSNQQIKNLPKDMIGIQRTESIEEMAELYSAADAFFNPTYEDNFPTTNIEALACGTPVITYNTGGSPEMLDSRTGRVVRQGDIDGVKSLLLSLDFKDLSASDCRARAEELYDDKIKFREYIELYRKYVDKF